MARKNELIIDLIRLKKDVTELIQRSGVTATCFLSARHLSTGYISEFAYAYAVKQLGLTGRDYLTKEQKAEYMTSPYGATSKAYFMDFCERLDLIPDNYICTVHINTSVEEDFSEPVVCATTVNLEDVSSDINDLKKAIYDLGRVQIQSMEYLKQLVDMWSK